MLASLDCRWVSHPHDVAHAEWKPLQLAVADRIGLSTPDTLITNDSAAARDFARGGGPVVCKPFSSIAFTEGDSTRIPFTTIMDADGLDDPATGKALTVTAVLLQRWVPKRCEARVVVAGNTVLGVAINAGSERAGIDWRTDYAHLRYTPITVPRAIATRLPHYLATFGLTFGVFDFVLTPDDEWIMLECNPAGQWLWLHHATNLPIPAAIADHLLTPT